MVKTEDYEPHGWTTREVSFHTTTVSVGTYKVGLTTTGPAVSEIADCTVLEILGVGF